MITNLKEELFLNNKYTKWYFSIVSKEKLLQRSTYTEKHHIIPKSLGGSNDITNIVILTAKEHFIVHWLLTKMCINDINARKMKYAMRSMSWNKTGNRIISSWQFELSRKKVSEAAKNRIVSETTRERISIAGKKRFESESNRMSMRKSKLSSPNSKHTDETKKKISSTSKERYKLEENRRITSKATKKAQNTEEFKRKRSLLTKQRYIEKPELKELISKQFKGVPKQKTQCPHCGKTGGVGPMNRWHFDNCKSKIYAIS